MADLEPALEVYPRGAVRSDAVRRHGEPLFRRLRVLRTACVRAVALARFTAGRVVQRDDGRCTSVPRRLGPTCTGTARVYRLAGLVGRKAAGSRTTYRVAHLRSPDSLSLPRQPVRIE